MWELYGVSFLDVDRLWWHDLAAMIVAVDRVRAARHREGSRER